MTRPAGPTRSGRVGSGQELFENLMDRVRSCWVGSVRATSFSQSHGPGQVTLTDPTRPDPTRSTRLYQTRGQPCTFLIIGAQILKVPLSKKNAYVSVGLCFCFVRFFVFHPARRRRLDTGWIEGLFEEKEEESRLPRQQHPDQVQRYGWQWRWRWRWWWWRGRGRRRER